MRHSKRAFLTIASFMAVCLPGISCSHTDKVDEACSIYNEAARRLMTADNASQIEDICADTDSKVRDLDIDLSELAPEQRERLRECAMSVTEALTEKTCGRDIGDDFRQD